MFRTRALRADAFAVLMLVSAACVAALLAHVAIDLAGDVVLAHDAYDGLDHGSRSEALLVVLTLAVGALVRFGWLALDEARTGRAGARRSFEGTFGRGPWRFVFLVVALTVPVLMTMEVFDVVADGRRLDDVSDLLGGSSWLGMSVTIPIAALVAQTVRSIATLVMNSRPALVTVIGRLLALLAKPLPRVGQRAAERDARLLPRRRSILARRSGKRGPPLPAG
jgi:hypothetical protein